MFADDTLEGMLLRYLQDMTERGDFEAKKLLKMLEEEGLLENCESKYKKFNPFREKNLKSYGIVDVTRSIVARRQNSYTDVWAVWAWGRGNQGVRYVQAKSHFEAIDQVLEGSK